MLSRNKKIIAGIELTTAANIWGFGFVATVWALEAMGPIWMTALRLVLAAGCSFPLLFLRSYFMGPKKSFDFKAIRHAFLPGICLGLTLTFQTWGLRYTTATKCGFITTLYVIFVPIVERIFWKKKITSLQVIYVFVAIFGMVLIANLEGLGTVNYGDFLTLICAIAATFQILSVGHYSRKVESALAFNTGQSFWAIFIPLGAACLFEAPPPMHIVSGKALFGFLFLTFASTGLAFLLQVRAQKYLDASIASMIFLLESPFAAVYAFYLLGERMLASQWIGAALILLSVLGSSWEENKKATPIPSAVAPL